VLAFRAGAATSRGSSISFSLSSGFSVMIVWLLAVFSFLGGASFSALRSAQRSESTDTKRKRDFRSPAAHVKEKVVERKSEIKNDAVRTITVPPGFKDASRASPKTIPNNPPAGRYPRTSGKDGASENEADNVKSLRIIPERR